MKGSPVAESRITGLSVPPISSPVSGPTDVEPGQKLDLTGNDILALKLKGHCIDSVFPIGVVIFMVGQHGLEKIERSQEVAVRLNLLR